MANTSTPKHSILPFASFILATASVVLGIMIWAQNSRILERVRRIECANNISAAGETFKIYSVDDSESWPAPQLDKKQSDQVHNSAQQP